MESTTLPKPIKVSGFIKATRWGLLMYGVIYGNLQWHIYHKRQQQIREERAKLWPAIQARQKAEKLENSTKEIKNIAADFGIELPPGWSAKDL